MATSLNIDKEFIFGTNKGEYNDGNIKYLSFNRSYYAVATVEENNTPLYLVVSVSRETGMVVIGSSTIDNIEAQIKNGIIERRTNVIKAFTHFDKVFNLLVNILKAYHIRIPRLIFKMTTPSTIKFFERITRIGNFKMVMAKYRYKVEEYGKAFEGDLYYLYSKPNDKKKREDRKAQKGEGGK